MPVASSRHHSGTVAAHHAFLGCAYFERFHNQKIKAFFRETMYAETREKIVINWVLSKARALAVAFLIFLGCLYSFFTQATKGNASSVLAAIDS